MTLPLDPLDPQSLDILSNDRDVLHDLFVYLDYVRERTIKRTTRGNEISRSDQVRLTKLLGIDQPAKDKWLFMRPGWLTFIDNLALNLGLVSYDTKGEYRGQSSQEPSFIDNVIDIGEAQLRKFIELSPAEQEIKILDALNLTVKLSSYSNNQFNEFFYFGPLGRLDVFDGWGSGTGIVPALKFSDVRLTLLSLLVQCPAGRWFSTQSLIAYLKENHPHFLIPKSLPLIDKWGHAVGRYDNFRESKLQAYEKETILPNDPDAFERVEGRYVERFFEYIPLIMRFVDLAYQTQEYTGLTPSRGVLAGFRINERFLRLMSREKAQPKVTIQPNFDVVIESDYFPARLIQQVAALGEHISSPSSGHGAYLGIYQLKKAYVASAMALQPDLEVIPLLKQISGRDLPANVQIELEEWAGHADQFVLYDGFGLLESTQIPAEVEKLTAEKITPGLYLMRSPEKVYATLETQGCVPLRVRHSPNGFTLIAESVVSVFPQETSAIQEPEQARRVKVSRVVTVSFQFPDEESFNATQKKLAEVRCPFQSAPKERIITIQQQEQTRFNEALAHMSGNFLIEVE